MIWLRRHPVTLMLALSLLATEVALILRGVA